MDYQVPYINTAHNGSFHAGYYLMGKKREHSVPIYFFSNRKLFHNVYNGFFLFYSGDTTDEYNLTIYCIQIKVNCG